MPVLACLPPFIQHSYTDNVSRVKTPESFQIPLPEFRKLLGEAAIDLSDAELEKLREWEERFADIFFDWWLRKRNREVGLPESPEE
jgi:hypothetical protein